VLVILRILTTGKRSVFNSVLFPLIYFRRIPHPQFENEERKKRLSKAINNNNNINNNSNNNSGNSFLNYDFFSRFGRESMRQTRLTDL
jgi:hypothetical protein